VQVSLEQSDQDSQAAETDTQVTDVPMTGDLTGAHFKKLDGDDAEVDFDLPNGTKLKFKNAKGYKKSKRNGCLRW
jgi:hypothetical protein